MFLLSLTATCQVWIVSLKAGLYTYNGLLHFLEAHKSYRGWALAMHSQGMEGIAQIQQGLATIRAQRGGADLSWLLVLLAEAYARAGHTDVGLGVLAEAMALMETEDRTHEPELHRLKGELLLAPAGGGEHSKEEAEACFKQALAVARRQQAKSLELRAAMSLARLWQPQGKRAEAYELLAPIYGWFTEGFDSADLQEAKALLEELS
jgi:predicted ATPase